jgi:hypothetical protein
MNEELSSSPSFFCHFRPSWRSAGLVLLCAVVCGILGVYIRLLSECWSDKQDCAGYFPLGIGISGLMSWPVFVAERLAFGEHGFVSSYDAVVTRYWWILVPVLWLYYYTMFACTRALVACIRSLGHRD